MKKGLVSVLMTVFWIGILFGIQVRAEEPGQGESTTVQGQIMKVEQAVEARQEPNDNSEIIVSFDAGAAVLVIDETADGWYKISYQGKEGYIRKSGIIAQDVDIAALDDEMEATSLRSKMVVEAVERYRAEVKRSRIWGTIIILLIVGILAVGIFSVVKAKKESGQEEEKQEKGDKEEQEIKEIEDIEIEDLDDMEVEDIGDDSKG